MHVQYHKFIAVHEWFFVMTGINASLSRKGARVYAMYMPSVRQLRGYVRTWASFADTPTDNIHNRAVYP